MNCWAEDRCALGEHRDEAVAVSERTIVLEVPDLQCELIRLRPWQLEDAPELVKAWADPQIVAESMMPEDRSLRVALQWISRADVRRRSGVALDLVIAGVANDCVLGEVGLSRFDNLRRAAMIGWWLSAPARGQGIATRAVNLLSEWAVDGPLSAIIAEIKMNNIKSLELAARCGFDLLRPARDSTPAVFVRSV